MADKIKKRTALGSSSAVTRRQFMGTTAKAVAAGTVVWLTAGGPVTAPPGTL